MQKPRARQVVSLAPAIERKNLLERLKRYRAEITAGIEAADLKAEQQQTARSRRRAGVTVALGSERAYGALDALWGVVEGFGRSIDEECLQRLDVGIRRLENGYPLPRGRFFESVLEDVGLRRPKEGPWTKLLKGRKRA